MDDQYIKVLLIEDNPGDVRLIQEMLVEAMSVPFDLECAGRLSTGLEWLTGGDFDVVLLDLGLPDSQGLDTLGRVLAGALKAPVIMVLTGLDDEALAIEAVRAGAQDYLVKGRLDSDLLARSLRYAIERKQVEKQLEHLNTVLRAIRDVNQLIVREKDRDRLVQSACKLLTETRGYHNAWIALTGESGELIATAEAGLGEDFLPLLEWLERGELPACGRRALAQSGVLVVMDPPITCSDCPLADQYAGRGGMTVRLEHGGRVYGLLSVSTPAHFATDETESGLFEEVAGDIAFALHSMELEERRKQAEAALRESEEKYRSLIEQSSDAIYLLYENRFEIINPRFTELFGVTPEEARAPDFDFMSLVAPQSRPLIEERRRKLAQGQEPTPRYEFTAQDEEGNEIELEVSASYIPYRDGTAVQGILRDITERKRAEETLRESEQRYRALFEGASEGILVADVETRVFRHANSAVCRMLGYSQEELRGMQIGDIHPQEALAHVISEFEAQARGKKTLSPNIPCLRKDGTVMYADISTAPALIDGRECNVGFFTDVTERKRADEALRQYTERLRTLHAIDGAILAAWSAEEMAQAALGHLRQLVDCWRASVAMFDSEIREARVLATHADVEIAIEAETGYALEMSTIEDLRRGKVHVVEDVLSLPQPSPLIQALHDEGLRSYVTVPLIAQGELIGSLNLGAETPGAFDPEHVNMAREVADQIAVGLHQAHLRTALEAEQGRLQALVEHLPEGILLLDDKRRILLANPAAQTYLSVLTSATVGDELARLAEHPVEKLLQSPPAGQWHELSVSGPPSRVFEVAAQEMAVEIEAGDWVVLLRDVTEERQVQEYNQRQERLAAVGQLAGGIAHDFNNMLTSIMLSAHMPLSKPGVPPKLTRAFETILSEARSAAELVQQILDFSRRSPVKTRPLDLRPFVKEATRILERTMVENIRLVRDVGTEAHIVKADPTRIQQVLLNLGTNARDAMPEGGELRIELARIEVKPDDDPPVADMPPGEWVCLAVADAGTGIPPDVLPHIFEPFFTTKEPGAGTGLGLAQVFGIVKQHEGYIGVETEEGQGTTFRVYLPAYSDSGPEELAKDEAFIAQGQGETILLVEDQERVRELGQRVLESLGYRVLTAANGREALELHRATKGIDLVITDLVMPEMGGRELVREMRKTNYGLRALAITGYATLEDPEASREEDFLAVVYKPFDLDTLAQVVRRVLDEQAGEEASQE